MNPIDQHARDDADRRYLKYRGVVGVGVVLGLLSGAAGAATVVQVATGFRARRFVQDRLAVRMARAILAAFGIEVEVVDPRGALAAVEPCVFIGNHTSTLDFFIVTGLGIPGLRGFMARKNALMLPVGVLGVMLQHFFLPSQADPEGRRAVFMRAAEVLRRTGEPVFLTPEGTRHLSGELGPFNKGAFHLAIALGRPIQPLRIEIPPEINPGKGFRTRPGKVTVRALDPIPTEGRAADPASLEAFAAEVRERMSARMA